MLSHSEMMENSDMIEEFGKILMQRVRDEAIRECDRRLKLGARSSVAERWRKTMQGGSTEAVLKEAIPDIVNSALGQLLDAIDEGSLHLSYTAENGKSVELHDGDVGALLGWLGGGPEGWITKYSKERFVDDNPNIEADIRRMYGGGT